MNFEDSPSEARSLYRNTKVCSQIRVAAGRKKVEKHRMLQKTT